ncbi:MAG: hypothetical protein JWR69_4536 [Pedosphaera sp.]|nr:hypothetical protein [Pedosphaera sp.]
MDSIRPDGRSLSTQSSFDLTSGGWKLLYWPNNRTNPLDHAAAQILLDAFLAGGRGGRQYLNPELLAELPVLHPLALGGDPFPGVGGGQGTDHRHQFPVALGLDLEPGEAVLLVEERDPFDQPGETLGKGLGRRCLQFPTASNCVPLQASHGRVLTRG